MKLEEIGKKADQTVNEVQSSSKTIKYIIYALLGLVVLGFASCTIRGCSSKQSVAVQQQAPVIVQNNSGSDMLTGALAGYVIGKTLMPDGSVYHGTPEQKTVIQKVYIQKNPQVVKPVETKVATPVQPVKVKNPGDATAELEKQKMEQEKQQKVKQEQLKADLKAKQAERKVSKPSSGGFKSFSQKASNSGSGRKK